MTIEGERDTALSPVTNATRRDVVVDAIRRALLGGELKPGERLKEAPLANSLGVSRPTIREAVHQLIHEGALVQEPYKGIRVANPSPQDLLDVADVRVSLETLAALELSKHPDGPGMMYLRRALQVHLDAIEVGDPVEAHTTHLALHRALWQGTGNQMLIRIWPLVASQIRLALSVDQAAYSNPERDAELHIRLVDVIASGDEERITAEVREHIGVSAAKAVELIERHSSSD